MYLGYPFGAGISLDKLEIRTNKDKVDFFQEKYKICLCLYLLISSFQNLIENNEFSVGLRKFWLTDKMFG